MNTNSTRRNGFLMMLFGWALLFFLLSFYYNHILGQRENPNQLSVLLAQEGELVLEKNAEGHYLLEGFLNDYQVTFLLDTGATQIAVPKSVADRVGLPYLSAREVQTASGVATARVTKIERLQLGNVFLFSNLRGVIIPDLGGDTVLLGMNALGQLHIVQQDGKLTIRPDKGAVKDQNG